MSVSTDTSMTMLHWVNGLPSQGFKNDQDGGSIKYWANGLPSVYLFSSSTGSAGGGASLTTNLLLLNVGR